MIWRRLRVAGKTSLADLHHIIQIAMGWDNEYLHSFHIYGEEYGIAYAGGMSFSHNAREIFLDGFGFDAGDRFTYTYNFNDYWHCDIRVEAIASSTQRSPWCTGGSGRQGANARYYKIDEVLALLEFAKNVVKADGQTKMRVFRPLLDHYESVCFNRKMINRQLKAYCSEQESGDAIQDTRGY